jgi:hypothetical protein
MRRTILYRLRGWPLARIALMVAGSLIGVWIADVTPIGTFSTNMDAEQQVIHVA